MKFSKILSDFVLLHRERRQLTSNATCAFPKRSPAKPGLRPRSHFESRERRLFDAIAKQHYFDLFNDTDGNDRQNFRGILEGTDISAINQFFEEVHRRYLEQTENAGHGAAGGSASTMDPNIILESDDEIN
jgi:hypothetical protein